MGVSLPQVVRLGLDVGLIVFQERVNRRGFRSSFLSWEGCHVHAGQV